MSFFSGYKPSPSNQNDKSFDLVVPAMLKESVSSASEHVIVERTPISNQLGLSSCVANATCDALEIILGIEDPSNVVQLSRLLAYWNARSYTHDTDKDGGTYISNAIDSFKTMGVCAESIWPYVEANVFVQPPLSAYKESLDNKISECYRIDGNGRARCDNVEAAIRANHPVVLATAIDDAFCAYRGSSKVIGPPSTWIGFHAMIIVGVRGTPGQREFLLRNSWDVTWGDSQRPGHAWVTENYIAWDQTNDLWCITRVPTLVF